MKRMAISLIIVSVVACGLWAAHQTVVPLASGGSMAGFMPQGALLCLEARDLSGMLREWNSSHEKAVWLASDNHEVFSRSRLFERLSQAQDEFAAAAGVPPDGAFLKQVAGRHAAIAIYNIGNLELLYITRLPTNDFMQSPLWQKRSQFEPREVAGGKFFVRTDPQSGRVVAFAAQDDVVVLGTREDLVAGAVSLIGGQKLATLEEESWYARAVKVAPREASELRMFVHLAEVAMTPQFRTYWIPRNVTEMRQYESSVSDFYRQPLTWREERMLLLKNAPEQSSDAGAKAVADILRLVPDEAGFYSASADPTAKETLERVNELLTPRPSVSPRVSQAPVATGSGVSGSESDLDVDISVAPATTKSGTRSDAALEELLARANVRAMLQLHRSVVRPDAVFVGLRSALVLASDRPWDTNAVHSALQQVISPAYTTSALGAAWETSSAGGPSFEPVDGLLSIAMAAEGRYLVLGNDAEFVTGVVARMQQPAVAAPAIYAAHFDHARERANYYRITSLIEHAASKPGEQGDEPKFFSQDVASVSKVLARVKSQTVTRKRDGAVERQQVVYEWEQ